MEQCNAQLAKSEWRFNDSTTLEGVHLMRPRDRRGGQPAAASEGQGELTNTDPMFRMLSVLVGPWTLYLAWTLLKDGPKRFSEIRRLIPGISSKVLTERLRLLESEQYAVRRPHSPGTPKVTYEATARLQELKPFLLGLSELAGRWYTDPSKANGQAQAASGQS